MRPGTVRLILIGIAVLLVIPVTSINMWASAAPQTEIRVAQLPPLPGEDDPETEELPDQLPTDILPTGTDEPSPTGSESPIEIPTDVPTCAPGAPDPIACPTVSPTASTSPTPTTTPSGGTATSSETSVTMKYAKGKFMGGVSSDSASCVAERSVVVKRVKNGKKTTVGRDTTNAKGRYVVPKANAKPGRYFAKALSDTVDTSDCLSGRSKAVRLPLKK